MRALPLLVLALVLAGCASTSTPTPATSSTPVSGTCVTPVNGQCVEPSVTTATTPSTSTTTTPVTTTAPPPTTTTAPPPMTTTSPPPTTTTQPAATTQFVTIQGFAFSPSSLTVKVGTTITWQNADNVGHTTTSDTGLWNSGRLSQGDAFSFTFGTPGTYGYHCAIHGSMKGTIVVTS